MTHNLSLSSVSNSLGIILLLIVSCGGNEEKSNNLEMIGIGVVVEEKSGFGKMVKLCLEMAIQDFYTSHPNYSTRVNLHIRNASTLLHSLSAAMELLENEKVEAIIWAQESAEETLFAELGDKSQVPIISFIPHSSSFSYTKTPFYMRMTSNVAVQADAIAAICKKFQWSEVALLYEQTGYGNQFLSHISKAFQSVEIRLAYMIDFSKLASNTDILRELKKIPMKQTRVFLVHMSPSLGFRLFKLAQTAGVMREGYAWLITDGLSVYMNNIDSEIHGSMEGVVGIRPNIPQTKEYHSFQRRFVRNIIVKNNEGNIMELNINGLWAYDAVTAFATAVEKLAINKTSRFGIDLVNELGGTRFTGLSGEFELLDGKLKPSDLEILNVFGSGEKIIGFWTPDVGIISDRSSRRKMDELKKLMWPGDSVTQPKGLEVNTVFNLKIGIPCKGGFKEFSSMDSNNKPTGFSVDIFQASLELLPYNFNTTYGCIENADWTYDSMLDDIPEVYDIIVGDVTIWAPRAEKVDFSLPFSESGAVLVVKNKKPYDMWIFVKPLRWDLWLSIIVACVIMGIVLRILERNAFHDAARMVYWSPLAVLAFPERNMVSNKWSFFVLVCWLFMAYILMQSYTANLSAILTLDQLKFAFSDNYNIGWQEGSYMKKFMIDQLHISESRLKNYSSAEAYHEAMSKGSKNGGIDAIFDEVPYMKLFMNKYDSQYKIAGPRYKTAGFGFAFQKGSPLVSNFSWAILEVTQNSNLTALEQKNFGPGYSTLDPLSSMISQETSSLTLYEFAGLFIIIGSITTFALFCSETTVGQKMITKTTEVLRFFKSSTVESIADGSSGRASLELEPNSTIILPMEHMDEHVFREQEVVEIQELGSTHDGNGHTTS